MYEYRNTTRSKPGTLSPGSRFCHPAKPESALTEFTLAECLAVIARVSLLVLASALCISTAAAQTASVPVGGGDRSQPTQQQIDRQENARASPRNRPAQRDVDDRLYDEIIRGATPSARSPSQ